MKICSEDHTLASCYEMIVIRSKAMEGIIKDFTNYIAILPELFFGDRELLKLNFKTNNVAEDLHLDSAFQFDRSIQVDGFE